MRPACIASENSVNIIVYTILYKRKLILFTTYHSALIHPKKSVFTNLKRYYFIALIQYFVDEMVT